MKIIIELVERIEPGEQAMNNKSSSSRVDSVESVAPTIDTSDGINQCESLWLFKLSKGFVLTIERN